MMIQPMMYPSNNWGFNYQVNRTNTSMSYLQDNYNNFVHQAAERINQISSSANANRTSINWLSERRVEMVATDSGLRESINWLSDRRVEMANSINEIYSITGALESKNTTLTNSIDWLSARRLEMLNSIDELYSLTAANSNKNAIQDDSISWLSARREEMVDSIEELYTLTAANTNKNSSQQESIDWLALQNSQKSNSIDELYSLTAANTNKNAIQDDSIYELYSLTGLYNNLMNDMLDILEKINNNIILNTGAIALTKYNDTELRELISDLFNNYFKANELAYEQGISSTDGFFTKIIKGQTTRTISEISRHLTMTIQEFHDVIDILETNFTLLLDWESLKSDYIDYIANEFTRLNDNLLGDLESPGWLEIINLNLETVIDYLSMLNDKEFSGGDTIINEPPAGTNFWDVLQSLIDGLTGVIEAILGIVPNLIEQLIRLIIPENLDFVSDKIDGLTTTIEQKIPLVAGTKDTFRQLYVVDESAQFEDYKFELSISDNPFNVTLPVSTLNNIGPIVKPFITAGILLSFLIDFYKWFHTRNEVIE